jgi:hypothetical protein
MVVSLPKAADGYLAAPVIKQALTREGGGELTGRAAVPHLFVDQHVGD